MNQAEHYVKTVRRLMQEAGMRLQREDQTLQQGRIWNEFVRRAKPYDTVDWKASLELARRYKSYPRCCFWNALQIARRRPKLYRYCEGFAVSIIPTEHAWLVDDAGTVYDPTWALMSHHKDSPPRDYYGITIPVAEVTRSRKQSDCQPAWLDLCLKGGAE